MSFNSSLNHIIKLVGVMALLFLMGCALNPLRLDKRIAKTDSSVVIINSELEKSNARIAKIESELNETGSKLASLETELNANNQETYLRVRVPILNIRTTPTTANNNVIAKAEEGAYLRKVSDVNGYPNWIRVEFLIDNYPYTGFIFDDQEFVEPEYYDPMTFNRVYNRKLIKYQWETEAAIEMKSNNFKTLGVYVKTDEPARKDRFLGHLAKSFRDHRIYIKPIENFNMSQVSRQCEQYGVEGIMAVDIQESTQETSQLDIKLFDRSSVILYSAFVPLQATELNGDLGWR